MPLVTPRRAAACQGLSLTLATGFPLSSSRLASGLSLLHKRARAHYALVSVSRVSRFNSRVLISKLPGGCTCTRCCSSSSASSSSTEERRSSSCESLNHSLNEGRKRVREMIDRNFPSLFDSRLHPSLSSLSFSDSSLRMKSRRECAVSFSLPH